MHPRIPDRIAVTIMNSNLFTLIFIPVISALVGWGTNFIAVRMIFHPRTPVGIPGVRIVGLIPKRKRDLALKIGQTVEKELISHKDIESIVKSPEFVQDVNTLIGGKIERIIKERLASSSLLSMLVGPKTMAAMKDMIAEEVGNLLPGLIDELFMKVESKIDFKEIIRRKIEAFELERLESIVYAIAARELKAIELYGGVIGALVGIVQATILVISRAS